MSTQEWRIEAPAGHAYTPAEVAHITRAAQAFLGVVSEVGAPKAYHAVRVDLGVLPESIKVAWPQPGGSAWYAACSVCGYDAWPEGGMHAARAIHMRGHQEASVAPLTDAEIAPDPGWPA